MINLFCVRPKGFNVGNDAIFLAMQQYLYEAFGGVVNLISIPATSRYESQAKAGLTPRTIHEINQYGDGVIVGGGNLYENGELEVNAAALKRLEVPLMLFSLSWGRIFSRKGQLVPRTDAMPDSVIQALHEKAIISLARDEATRKHLHSIGCKKAIIGGCPTVFLGRMVSRLPILDGQESDEALISIRNPVLMNIPLQRQVKVRNDIIRMISLLKRRGYKSVRLLCHDYRDIEFAASFENQEYIYTGDVWSYMSRLRSCKMHVSYRLHATLPRAAFGRPSIKISYDERGLSLMETLGLGEWNINFITTPDVVAAVEQRLDAVDGFSVVLENACKQWGKFDEIMRNSFKNFAEAVDAQM